MFRSLLPLAMALLLTCPAIAEDKPPRKEVLAIRAHLSRFARPPSGWSGAATVLAEFRLAADGVLVSHRVRQSSGSAIVDRAALDSIARASPFPPPPSDGDVVFVVPFAFEATPLPVPRPDDRTPDQKNRDHDHALGLHPPE